MESGAAQSTDAWKAMQVVNEHYSDNTVVWRRPMRGKRCRGPLQASVVLPIKRGIIIPPPKMVIWLQEMTFKDSSKGPGT